MWPGTSEAHGVTMIQLTDYTTARILADDHTSDLRRSGSRPLFRRGRRSADQRTARRS